MKRRRAEVVERMFEDFFGHRAEGSTPTKPKVPAAAAPPPKPVKPPPPPEPPRPFNPAVHMDCGHWQVQFIPRVKVEGESAYHARGPTQISVTVKSPEDCHMCRLGVPGQPQYESAAFRKPVHPSRRRTLARANDGPAWPGFCCDDDGFYIGGLANDCRSNSHGSRCEVHRAGR